MLPLYYVHALTIHDPNVFLYVCDIDVDPRGWTIDKNKATTWKTIQGAERSLQNIRISPKGSDIIGNASEAFKG